MAMNAKNMPADELFFGHKACAGCGGSLAVRAALKVLGPNAVAALPAGCMSAVGFNFPQLCFANNAMITPFAATAAVLTGIEAGLRAQGKMPDDCTVVGFAGDGGSEAAPAVGIALQPADAAARPRVRVDAQEQAAHEARLAALQKKSGRCIWLQLDADAA